MMLMPNSQNLAPIDGELYFIKQFYQPAIADALFQQLLTELAWQEESIFIFGRGVKVPRLMCWYGDEQAFYRYSQVVHRPLPWNASLRNMQRELEQVSGCAFNSVLGNLYRNGNDSMGCHADDEPELGQNPVIASLSFGDSRQLKFKHKRSNIVLDVLLEQGDLLLMAGTLQHHWQHQLPKTRQPKSARINLTFRHISIATY